MTKMLEYLKIMVQALMLMMIGTLNTTMWGQMSDVSTIYAILSGFV
jgi:hypothetical protein